MPYTVDDLIKNIKRRGSIPTSQNLFTNDTFAAMSTDELVSYVVPIIISVQEEYFVAFRSYELDPANNAYQIPSDAVGNSLRDLVFVTDDSEQNLQLVNIPRLDLEKISGGVWYGRPGLLGISGFYLQGNTIKLYPAAQSQSTLGSLRAYYYRRCLELIPNNSCFKVKTILDPIAGTLEGYDLVPVNFEVGQAMNAVEESSTFDTHATGVTLLDIPDDRTIRLSSVAGIQVNDWVSLQGFSCVVQIPTEAQAVLAQAVVVKCLEALADDTGMERAQAKLKELEEHMLKVMSPRVVGASKKVTTAGSGIFDSLTRPWGRR